MSPTKGIDTILSMLSNMHVATSRNGVSPTKGIDTVFTCSNFGKYPGRNGESPLKGIDTHLLDFLICAFHLCRNGESPAKGMNILYKKVRKARFYRAL